MGAGVARLRTATQQCWGQSAAGALEIFEGEQELLLRVVSAPIEDSRGAHLTGYKEGVELKIAELLTERGLERLGWRYREKSRQQWPPSYRFQISKRSWHVKVYDELGCEQACVLQMAASPDERTLQNTKLDVDDARVAASYAHRFNLQQMQACSGAAGPEAPMPETGLAPPGPAVEDDSIPKVRVAAPVVCEVVASGYPSMVPVGVFVTLAPYAEKEVQKFVFEGVSDEFSELPQAYFHYAAFSSGGKEYVCDIQGAEDENGSFLFVDPCVLRANLPTVRDLVGVVVNAQDQGAYSNMGPSVERFDALHPKCTCACKTFDPQRRSAQRNGKVGMCGMAGTCGINLAKCGR